MTESRYRLTEAPEQAPGCDFVTKSVVGPFIDTGITLDTLMPRGRLYLSVETIREMAEVAGLFDTAESTESTELAEREQFNKGVIEGARLGGSLERAIGDLLGRLGPAPAADERRDDPAVPPVVSATGGDGIEGAAGDGILVRGDGEGAAAPAVGAPASLAKQGSDDVSGAPGDGSAFGL